MLKLTTRAAPLVSSTLDTDKRTVQMVWTTGARVLRGGYEPFYEELSLDPKHVQMDRLRNGAPVLDAHDASGIDSIIGVVESAHLEKARGVATIRFDTGPKGEDAMRRVREGTLRGVSVGYRIDKFQKVGEQDDTPVYRATAWTPHELSLTPIGADAGAQVRSRSTKDKAMKTKNRTRSHANPPAEIADRVVDDASTRDDDTDDEIDTRSAPTADAMAAERDRSATIARVARAMGQGLSLRDQAELERFGDQMIRSGVPLERAKARLVDERAERGIITIDRAPCSVTGGDRNHDAQRVELMAEAFACRFGGPKPSDEARQYMNLSTMDFARSFLEQAGVNTRTLSKSQIMARAFEGGVSTGDLPNLLQSTGNRLLRNAYESYQGGLQRVAHGPVPAPDFRPLQRLQLGEAATLLKVNENGEFANGGIAEAKESYSISTFGRIFSLSRQAIVNDDLNAFAQMATKLGRAASEFIAGQLAALLASNPTLAQDSTAVFHANHGNLAASGSTISVLSLGAALAAMRLQKGIDKVTPIDATPKFLIVPAALETTALQAIAQITPTAVANVNPFSGKLELVVDPRLDAYSALTWYLAADPGLVDGIEYAFLDGTGVFLDMEQGFRVDGINWKVRLDFGAGILDYRGLYKNPGV